MITMGICSRTKNFLFGLRKDADNNLEHETDSIINHNERLAGNTIKNEGRQLLSKYKHVDLRSSKKHVAFQNFFIYYT